MKVIYLAVILSIIALFATATTNPQQVKCAKPAKGCGSQARETSCTNWHGCRWRCVRSGKNICVANPPLDGRGAKCANHLRAPCCVAETAATCETKPTRIPTSSPTVATDSPTRSPTVPCRQPENGCGSLNANTCGQFNGCAFNPVNNRCQSGGCAGTETPTASPTQCTGIPSTGSCLGLTQAQCAGFNCCTWNPFGVCVKIGQNPPCKYIKTNLLSTSRTLCQRRSDCIWRNGQCLGRTG